MLVTHKDRRNNYLLIKSKTVFFLVGLLLTISSSSLAAQYCSECISISADKPVYKPREQVEILINLQAELVSGVVADAYVVIVFPNGLKEFSWQKMDWPIAGLSNKKIVLERLDNKFLGSYQLYFVLVRTGTDLMDFNWLAAANTYISQFSEEWSFSGNSHDFYNESELPQLISHGGGEISSRQNYSGSNFCHAYYGGSELIIPGLSYGNQYRAIRVQEIPGQNQHFQMVENFSTTRVLTFSFVLSSMMSFKT